MKHIKSSKILPCTFAIILLLFISTVKAQNKIPVLKSGSDKLDIILDGITDYGCWTIDPTVHPDIFDTSAKHVVFKSDIDSISFDVKRNGIYDFVVLETGKDSAFTQIRWTSDNIYADPPKYMIKLSPTGMISKEQAIFDVNAMVYTLSEVHPNMFSVCPQGKFMSEVNNVIRELPDSLNRITLYKYIAPLIPLIGDAHTSLRLPTNEFSATTSLFFPLSIKVNADRSLTAERSMFNVPKDAKILSINGISSKEITEKMLTYISSEKDFLKVSRLNNYFSGLFEILYHSDKYEILYEDKMKKRVKKILPAVSQIEKKKEMLTNGPAKELPHTDYSYQILEDKNTAIMNFSQFNDPQKMETFANAMITELNQKHIGNLIIDIRSNGGGNSNVGDALLKYISPCPFTQFGKTIVRVTPTTQQLMNNKLMIGWTYYDSADLIQPNDKCHYNGKVWLLINHLTFSSASSFAWAFNYFKMGKVIGEETGGMSVSYGDILNYKLPVSQLDMSISFKRFSLYHADEKNIHGVLPDYNVPEALDYTLKLIQKKK